MTTATMDYAGLDLDLDLDFLVEDESGELGYPSLQATIYQPTKLSTRALSHLDESDYIKVDGVAYDRPKMAISEIAFNQLDATQAARLLTSFEAASFEHDGKTEESLLAVLPESVRYVFLSKPGLFKRHNKTREVTRIKKGDKMKAMDCKSITCALIALVVDGDPILDSEGKVQIFRLNLVSSKSALISGDKQFPDMRSLDSLNKGLVARYKEKGLLDAKAAQKARLTHMVSVSIIAMPKVFTSAEKESSTGIMFEMVGGAQPLPKAAQKLIHELISTDEFKAYNADPFGISGKAETVEKAIVLDDAEEIDFPA